MTLLISVTREDFNKFLIYSFAREKHNSIAWENRGFAIWNNKIIPMINSNK